MNKRELEIIKTRGISDGKLLTNFCVEYKEVKGIDNPVLTISSERLMEKLYFSREFEIKEKLGLRGADLDFPSSFPSDFKFDENHINFVIIKEASWSDGYNHEDFSIHLIGSCVKSVEEVVHLFRYKRLDNTGSLFPSPREERKAAEYAERRSQEEAPKLLRGETLHFKCKDSLREGMFEHRTFQIISSGKMEIRDGMIKFYDSPDNDTQKEVKEKFPKIKIKFIGKSESA